jgi:hypothetical protein
VEAIKQGRGDGKRVFGDGPIYVRVFFVCLASFSVISLGPSSHFGLDDRPPRLDAAVKGRKF